MPLNLKTPGVYIQEITTLPASVAQVETAIPAFIGYTTKTGAPTDPVRISSLVEYEEKFGGPYKSVKINISGTGAGASITSVEVDHVFYLYEAMQLYFANGGGPCYVISAGNATGAVASTAFYNTGAVTEPLTKLAKEDEPTIIVMPELMSATNTGATNTGSYYSVIQQALAQCNLLKDRFTIIDTYQGFSTALTDPVGKLRDDIGTQYLKYGAAYYPQLKTSLTFRNDAIYFNGGGAGITTETLAKVIADSEVEGAGGLAAGTFLTTIQLALTEELNKLQITLPASPAVAGVYASVDRDRGVWKAPANVSVSSVTEPSVKITNGTQDGMNVDSTGKSINAIRTFRGKGTLVWGARTLAGNDNEWKYIPVRRLFITMEESIKKATEFVVFEPNDKNTWVRTKAMIENYLTGLWRQGALAGAKPEDAFFVNVGLGETMTAQNILDGELIIEIGVAAVRPAEFIILNFSHKLQES